MTKNFGIPLTKATQVKVVRRRVLQHDLDMYSAIAGKPADMSPARESTEEAIKVSTAARAKPWSSAVLANYLGNLTMPKLAVRVVRPEVADWVRRLSNHALERLHEAQERLAASRPSERVTHHHATTHSRADVAAPRPAATSKKSAA
jgi:hypothetical protein